MKYYNITTRKRPEFNELYAKLTKEAFVGIVCTCGEVLMNRQVTFEHWNSGHFDVYDEYHMSVQE